MGPPVSVRRPPMRSDHSLRSSCTNLLSIASRRCRRARRHAVLRTVCQKQGAPQLPRHKQVPSQVDAMWGRLTNYSGSWTSLWPPFTQNRHGTWSDGFSQSASDLWETLCWMIWKQETGSEAELMTEYTDPCTSPTAWKVHLQTNLCILYFRVG